MPSWFCYFWRPGLNPLLGAYLQACSSLGSIFAQCTVLQDQFSELQNRRTFSGQPWKPPYGSMEQELTEILGLQAWFWVSDHLIKIANLWSEPEFHQGQGQEYKFYTSALWAVLRSGEEKQPTLSHSPRSSWWFLSQTHLFKELFQPSFFRSRLFCWSFALNSECESWYLTSQFSQFYPEILEAMTSEGPVERGGNSASCRLRPRRNSYCSSSHRLNHQPLQN